MKIKKLYIIVVALFLLFQISCNKETLVESGTSGSELGTLTLYSDRTLFCGSLSVYVDDRLVGKLMTNVSSTPSCGAPTSAYAITIKVKEGFQYVKTTGSKSACVMSNRIWVGKGQCVVSPIQ